MDSEMDLRTDNAAPSAQRVQYGAFGASSKSLPVNSNVAFG
jgi:hypothetical protein